MSSLTPDTDENPLFAIWESGRVTIGCSCKIWSPLAAEAIAASGLDYVYIDQQHGVFDALGLLTMFQAVCAAGSVPLTRVSANRLDAIGSALDMGAYGVIVPAVEDRKQAAKAVRACHYPPTGARSHGHVRPSGVTPLCVVLVETRLGLENVGAIAETEGVDAIMVGAQDLALSLGIALEGDWLQSDVLSAAIGEILSACKSAGTVSAIGASSGKEAIRWIEAGFQMVNLGSDLAHLKTAVYEQVAIARRAVQAVGR